MLSCTYLTYTHTHTPMYTQLFAIRKCTRVSSPFNHSLAWWMKLRWTNEWMGGNWKRYVKWLANRNGVCARVSKQMIECSEAKFREHYKGFYVAEKHEIDWCVSDFFFLECIMTLTRFSHQYMMCCGLFFRSIQKLIDPIEFYLFAFLVSSYRCSFFMWLYKIEMIVANNSQMWLCSALFFMGNFHVKSILDSRTKGLFTVFFPFGLSFNWK